MSATLAHKGCYEAQSTASFTGCARCSVSFIVRQSSLLCVDLLYSTHAQSYPQNAQPAATLAGARLQARKAPRLRRLHTRLLDEQGTASMAKAKKVRVADTRKPKHPLDANRPAKGGRNQRDAATVWVFILLYLCGLLVHPVTRRRGAEVCAANLQVRRLNMYKKTATRDKRGKILHQVYHCTSRCWRRSAAWAATR